MAKLEGKVAIVTGAASGIGAAIARLFAGEGAKVVVADFNGVGADVVAHEIKGKSIKINVADSVDIQNMVEVTMKEYGRIDILVNNAGAGSSPTALHETDENDWDKVIDVNLKGVFLGMKYAIPHMIKQRGGTIINIASIAGMIGAPGLTPYAAAKAGVIELTRVAAAEYSRFGIRCNTIAPGWTKTPMVDSYASGGVGEERMLQGIPMRRFGEASEVARTALFLADGDADFVQGTTIVIDGGITAI